MDPCDLDLCANVGHYGVSAYAYFCAHHQRWCASLDVYDCEAKHHVWREFRQFGPFDDSTDVAQYLARGVIYGLERVLVETAKAV